MTTYLVTFRDGHSVKACSENGVTAQFLSARATNRKVSDIAVVSVVK